MLYYDTDSVIYLWEPGKPSVPVDDYLGCMTDELEGDVIQEFVSGGAKNYGYVSVVERWSVKCAGLPSMCVGLPC